MPTKPELQATNEALTDEVGILEAKLRETEGMHADAVKERDADRRRLRELRQALLPLESHRTRIGELLEELDDAKTELVAATLNLEVPEASTGAEAMDEFLRRG
jgi:chromosome segregation ATPase